MDRNRRLRWWVPLILVLALGACDRLDTYDLDTYDDPSRTDPEGRTDRVDVRSNGPVGDDVSGPSPVEAITREWLREEAGLRAVSELEVPRPPNNPANPQRVALGHQLFFDPILSGERDVSCATCHHPDLAWADGRPLSIGVGGGGPHGRALGPERTTGVSRVTGRELLTSARNAPTILNVAFNGRMGPEPAVFGLHFWDGRADRGLEAQSLLPLGAEDEMAGHAFTSQMAVDEIVERLRDIPAYEAAFLDGFPELTDAPTAVTASTLARALAAFQRSLVTPDAPLDRWLLGDDRALDDAAHRGMEVFFGAGRCGVCHFGPMLSDFRFHVLGTHQAGPGRPGSRGFDRGRYDVTGDPDDAYAFRTPSLRNVGRTAPYMHAGTYASLEDVVAFFERGGNDEGLAPDRLDPALQPVTLTTEEEAALIAFLRALDGELPDVDVPESVPSGLTPVFGEAASP